MEKETRSAIERAAQRARQILETDFTDQLQGDYDVMLDGRVGKAAGAHLAGRQKALRARIVAAIEHKRMAGMTPKDAVADYLRDAAFTTLNRFVALKMLEARGLVQECITKGDASSGFINEYLAFAPGVKFPDGSGYRNQAEKYQKILARDGVKLEILTSRGALDNLDKLANPAAKVDVGFVQGGLAEGRELPHLVSLGSVYPQPMMVYCRHPEPVELLSQLKGKRIAVGPEGSGARVLAQKLLKINEIHRDLWKALE